MKCETNYDVNNLKKKVKRLIKIKHNSNSQILCNVSKMNIDCMENSDDLKIVNALYTMRAEQVLWRNDKVRLH